MLPGLRAEPSSEGVRDRSFTQGGMEEVGVLLSSAKVLYNWDTVDIPQGLSIA